MSATPWALAAVYMALALGEGATWLALAILAIGEARGSPRIAWPRLATLPGAVGLAVYVGAGMAAWVAGGYGCLRPQALARLMPFLAWPLLYRAVRRAGAHGTGRALVAGGVSLALAVATSFWAMAAGKGWAGLGGWLRLDALVGEQSLVPGGTGAAMGGLYGHKLKMAHVLLVALGPLVARQILAPLTRRRRLAEGCVTAFFIAALGLTYARAAYVGAALGGFVLSAASAVLWQPARRRLALGWALGVLMLVVGTLLAPTVRARLVSSAESGAAQVRGIIWSQAVRICQEHPLGVGLGNYPHVVGRYYAAADPLTPSPVTYPHSLLWAAWAEAGPVGAWGLMAFWAAPLVAALGVLAGRAKGPAAGAAREAAGAGLFIGAALWAVGMTHDVLFHAEVALAYAAALGTAQGLFAHRADKLVR